VLNWLKDLIAPVRVTDPELGPLRYYRDTGAWQGWMAFVPTNTQVEILLKGPQSGPTVGQRHILREISERYVALWPSLHFELCGCNPSGGGRCAQRLILQSISLSEMESGEAATWDMGYNVNTADELESFVIVHLQGWKPICVSADD